MSSSLAVTPLTTAPALQYPDWQREYLGALFELNPANLPQRIMIAEFVLRKRLRVIAQNESAAFERRKVETALSNLRWLMLALG